MTVYLSADHAGFALKEEIKKHLGEKKYTIIDLGTYSADPVNWVEFGAKAAEKISLDPEGSRAILVCGSGIGMSIVANKYKHVRAAQGYDEYTAEMSRRHNNANVLTLGARNISIDKALKITDIWLNTPFDGDRHQQRLDYLKNNTETNNFK